MPASVRRDESASCEQLRSELVVAGAQVALLRAAYSEAMADGGMAYWIATAASTMRAEKGRMMVHVAAELSTAESKISRFERHISFPRNLDETIAAYARDLEVRPIEIWERALKLWREDPAATAPPVAGDLPKPGGALGRELATDPPNTQGPTRKPSRPAAGSRRRNAG